MLDGLTPPLQLAAIEGDAVFALGPASVVARGETLLELIEATYAGFRRRRDVMQSRTTCTCAACAEHRHPRPQVRHALRAVRLAGARRRPLPGRPRGQPRPPPAEERSSPARPAGAAYALFTDTALERLGVDAGGRCTAASSATTPRRRRRWPPSISHTRLEALLAEPVEPGESHWTAGLDLPVPPTELWQWLNEPTRRSRWRERPRRRGGAAAGGRTGPGAVYHCHHGGSVLDHTIVDWRPFSVVHRGGATSVWCARAAHLAARAGGRRHAPSPRRRPCPRRCPAPFGGESAGRSATGSSAATSPGSSRCSWRKRHEVPRGRLLRRRAAARGPRDRARRAAPDRRRSSGCPRSGSAAPSCTRSAASGSGRRRPCSGTRAPASSRRSATTSLRSSPETRSSSPGRRRAATAPTAAAAGRPPASTCTARSATARSSTGRPG